MQLKEECELDTFSTYVVIFAVKEAVIEVVRNSPGRGPRRGSILGTHLKFFNVIYVIELNYHLFNGRGKHSKISQSLCEVYGHYGLSHSL